MTWGFEDWKQTPGIKLHHASIIVFALLQIVCSKGSNAVVLKIHYKSWSEDEHKSGLNTLSSAVLDM